MLSLREQLERDKARKQAKKGARRVANALRKVYSDPEQRHGLRPISAAEAIQRIAEGDIPTVSPQGAPVFKA